VTLQEKERIIVKLLQVKKKYKISQQEESRNLQFKENNQGINSKQNMVLRAGWRR
jgi:hypothetical protein